MSDPTVLGMINERLGSIDITQQEISKTVNKMDKAQAVDSKRLDHLEKKVDGIEDGQKKIKKSLFNHTSGDASKKLHYNQGYKETFGQRTWRRKDLIVLLTSIFGIISLIVNHYYG